MTITNYELSIIVISEVEDTLIVARARKSRAKTGVAGRPSLPQFSLDFFSPSPQFHSSRTTESLEQVI